jgi:hypothetical protein
MFGGAYFGETVLGDTVVLRFQNMRFQNMFIKPCFLIRLLINKFPAKQGTYFGIDALDFGTESSF